MIQLSAVIITYNEEKKIEKCLSSLVNVVDEIVVVDSYSTDRTEEICNHYNVKFVQQKFLGYVKQKNYAITQASFDYILSLDADEALSKELQESVIKLKSNWVYDGYYMNRFNNFCGQWIKYSGWYPDRKLRAFIKDRGEWQGMDPHDSFKLYDSKNFALLNGDILHWNYLTYGEYNQQIEKFSAIAAQSYYENHAKAPLWKIVINPMWEFFRAYIIRLGFLDGFNGFVICTQNAYLTFLKYIKLRELYKRAKESN